VIDEALAKKYFGAENPIGKRIHLGDDEDLLQIVGVVGTSSNGTSVRTTISLSRLSSTSHSEQCRTTS
jgi:hypothetical protein